MAPLSAGLERGHQLFRSLQVAYFRRSDAIRQSNDIQRLTYILTQIGKVLELTEIERRLIMLERKNG